MKIRRPENAAIPDFHDFLTSARPELFVGFFLVEEKLDGLDVVALWGEVEDEPVLGLRAAQEDRF